MRPGKFSLLIALAVSSGCANSSAPENDSPHANRDFALAPAPTDGGVSRRDAAVPDASIRDAAIADAARAADLSTAAPVDLALRSPPPFPAYSGASCPLLVSGATAATSLNTGFPSAGSARNFRLLVPPSYDGTQPYPLMFAWHWLGGSSASFVSDGDLETAAAGMNFIIALPDNLRDAKGNKVYQLDWPFAEFWGIPSEITFFNDLLACIDQQFKVDHRRVYGVGVSAGALWVTYLSTTDRADYFAAVESLSGGLGQLSPVFNMQYVPQTNKFPALVLWGGANDWFIIDFAGASTRYRDALINDDHFVVTCTHDMGHAMPPLPDPPDGGTRFHSLWEFMLDHPYGLPPKTSPYQKTGLPSDYPSWCGIATP